MITIDEETHKSAKEKGLNISQECQKALEKKLNILNLQVEEKNHCERCGREMRTATKDNSWGLNFLYPGERWICPFCLQTEINKVIATKH